MKTLTKGFDPNSLSLLVDNIDIKPFAQMENGMIEDGIIVKIGRYNLEDLLCQLLDDYGEDAIINKIKELR